MTDSALIEATRRELVFANRILAREGVIDGFGHVSARHPVDHGRYFISRSRSPELVEINDIMEFTLDGEPVDRQGRSIYAERAIHSAIFSARPDVGAVAHFHAQAVIPFGVLGEPLKPLYHMAALAGANVGIWDSRQDFGDTDMRVTDANQGRSLAAKLGADRAILMRGHGAVAVGRDLKIAVMTAIYLKVNAELILKTRQSGGTPTYLSEGEIAQTDSMLQQPLSAERAWEYFVARAGYGGI